MKNAYFFATAIIFPSERLVSGARFFMWIRFKAMLRNMFTFATVYSFRGQEIKSAQHLHYIRPMFAAHFAYLEICNQHTVAR